MARVDCRARGMACPDGSAQIESIIPAMPFSTKVTRLDEILRILSPYRLAFGQPCQQELLKIC